MSKINVYDATTGNVVGVLVYPEMYVESDDEDLVFLVESAVEDGILRMVPGGHSGKEIVDKVRFVTVEDDEFFIALDEYLTGEGYDLRYSEVQLKLRLF